MAAKFIDKISDKLEEFRIAGGSPQYIALCPAVYKAVEKELNDLRLERNQPTAKLKEFLGVIVIPTDGQDMPSDGIYIRDANKKDESHPFPKRGVK